MFETVPYRKELRRGYPDPFRVFDEMEREFFERGFFGGRPHDRGTFRTDVRETETGYLLESDLPGFRKEDISVEIEGDLLTVSAVRNEETEDKEGANGYLRKERRTGSFSRSFELTGIRTEDITASYENGVLRLELPKKEKTAPEKRRLEII